MSAHARARWASRAVATTAARSRVSRLRLEGALARRWRGVRAVSASADDAKGTVDVEHSCEVSHARDGAAQTSRKAAMAACKKFLAAAKPSREGDGDGDRERRTYDATMTYVRELAEEYDLPVHRVIWAPAFWAVVARERWSAEEVAAATEELKGSGAPYLIEKYALMRDIEACERVYDACIKGGWYGTDEMRALNMSMAKAYDGNRGGAARADAMWDDILHNAILSAKARCEAYCELFEGRCLQPMRFESFVRAYGAFRKEFREPATGEWRHGVSKLHVQRVYTAACRMINNTHNSKFAKSIMRDVLHDHTKYHRDENFVLATDFIVCALLGSSSEGVVVARELFEIALESGVKLGGQTWAYVVIMYAREGMLDDAMKLLERLEGLPFMQSGSLGALAFAAAFSVDGSSKNPAAAAKMQKRAKELQIVEANNAKQRQKIERAYADVMSGLNKNGQPQLALRAFTRMQSAGVRPTSAHTYRHLYNALKLSDAGHSAPRQLLYRTMQTVKTHLKGVDAIMVALDVAAHDGVADVAEDIYDRLRWHGYMRDVTIKSRVYDCLMITNYHTRDQGGAMELYQRVQRDTDVVVSDDFWFHLIKTHCDEPANVELAMALLEDAIRENASRRRKALPITAFNVVLYACVRSKTPTMAMKVLTVARNAGARLTRASYLSAIRACANAALMQRDVSHERDSVIGDERDDPVVMARRLLDDMRKDDIAPTPKIWSAVLLACASARDVDAARDVFQDMRSSGCEPDVYSCTALMQAYAAVHDVRGAVAMYWTMREEFKCAPNAGTLHAILDVVRGATSMKKTHSGGDIIDDDVMNLASEVYLDMRRLKVKPNNKIFELLTESWVEDAFAPDAGGKKNFARFALNDFNTLSSTTQSFDPATTRWEDFAKLDVHEYSVAEARVVVLGVLQHLRECRARGGDVEGDVVVVCGVGKIREQIFKLASDVRLVLTETENAGRVVFTRDALEVWLDKASSASNARAT